MLQTPVGGTLTIPDENGQPVRVRIVGTLQDSPFQSELLMSDTNFRKLYPRQEGYRVFVIDMPAENQSEYVEILETGLRANGLVATPTVEKVAVYQAVVGAYLSTFQLLGGFALLLAVMGLGVVVLRSVWERVGELALLRAVGFGTTALQAMVVAETLLVLAVGLGVGVASAVASVLPNLALGGELPYARFLYLALAVGVVGLVVAWLATAGVARMPLVPALRKE
jgi:ABC-type antimicrobial peptide transport system permease subunit